uniref:Capsid protein n=1 Tax=Sesame curly top virus TaxID=2487726 RepID=A0A7D5XZT0_9GEMI|nr:coat protein [Sesame curly top virus]
MSTWSGVKRERPPYTPGYALRNPSPYKRSGVGRSLFQTPSAPVARRRRVWMKSRRTSSKNKLMPSEIQVYKDGIGSGTNGATVSSNGLITMLNNYSRGIGRDMRNSVVTKTVHMHFDAVLMANDRFWEAPNCMTMYSWIIYDREPGGTFPIITDIFDMTHKGFPMLYKVQANVRDRFIVKRKFTSVLRSTGQAYGEKSSYKAPVMPPVKKPISVKMRNCWIKSDWKDTAGGKYEDLKSGAILFVCINDDTNSGFDFSLLGDWTMYFVNPR